ncbi:RNA recognition motif domain-containing protein [Vibrio sp. WJH972]
MNSNKSLIASAIFAVIGTIVLAVLSFPPAVSFLIGVIGTTLIFIYTSNKTQSATEQESSESGSTTTLYIGNLPYKANETNVKELFSEYGEVFAVRLMKDKKTGKRRGFGFVVIADSAVQHTIDNLNEFNYQGRTLKVRVANDPKDQSSNNE